jgi:hypothetical protein
MGSSPKGGGSGLVWVLSFSPGMKNALYIASSHPRLCMMKSHNLEEVTLFAQNTADLKE